MHTVKVKPTIIIMLLVNFILMSSIASAKMDSFVDGPVIKGFGKNATVEGLNLNKNMQLNVAFDVASQAESGKINRKFDSLARFINMHVAAGLNPNNINLALVVHGKASFDLLDHPTYSKLYEQNNANKALLTLLMKNNVKVYLCGQSAAAYDVLESQLVEGVEMHLSAMTAHAILQNEGYTLNPF